MQILQSCAEHSQANSADKIFWKMYNLIQELWKFLLSGAQFTWSLSPVESGATYPIALLLHGEKSAAVH